MSDIPRMPVRSDMGAIVEIMNAASRLPGGYQPIAFTTAELNAVSRARHPTLPLLMFGLPIVEVPSWPRWLDTAAWAALDFDITIQDGA